MDIKDIDSDELWARLCAPHFHPEGIDRHEKALAALDGITFIFGKNKLPDESMESVLVVRDRMAVWVSEWFLDNWVKAHEVNFSLWPCRYRLRDLPDNLNNAVLVALDKIWLEFNGDGYGHE